LKTFNQKIVTENSRTESFNVNIGVRQDDELSVILINSTALYCKEIKYQEYIWYNGICTDDVVILFRTLEALEEALQEVDNTAQEVGLLIN